MVLSLLIVLEPRVEDWGDEGRGGPTANSGSGPVFGVVLELIMAMELLWGAAPNGRTTLNKRTLSAGRDIYIQGNTLWGHITRLLPLS